MLTFPSQLLCNSVCLLPGCQSCHSVDAPAWETYEKGTINELCGVRGILKAILFEESERKVSPITAGEVPCQQLGRHTERTGMS